MVKETEIINGKIQSKNISCSIDRRIYPILKLKYLSDSQIIRNFFIKRLNLKDEWELQNWLSEKLNEEAKISKRDKITNLIEKELTPDAIEFAKTKLKKEELSFLERTEIKNNITEAERGLE